MSRWGEVGGGAWCLWVAAVAVVLTGCAAGNDSAGQATAEESPVPTAPALGDADTADTADEAELPPVDVSRFELQPIKEYAAGSSPDTTRTGEDWPQFLGLRDNGISGETGLLKTWPAKGPPVLWEKEVGTGYSAPSVRGNRLVVHHRRRREEVVDCLEADTGKPLWQFAYSSNFQDPYGYNNGPRCSPLLTETRCYTFGAEGKLLCLDLETGKKLWMRDTARDWAIPDAFFGVGSTPILLGQLLIVMVGGEPKSAVVAFDARNGETVWENVGKAAVQAPNGIDPLDDKLASYSSPLAVRFHGEWHVLAWLRDGLVSLDPRDGKIRFSYFFRSRSFESVNAARPVVVNDQILLSAAYRTGAALLQVGKDGTAEELWQNRNLETHWSTPICHKGFAYGFSGRHEPEATFRCLDLKTGEVAWATEGSGPDVATNPKDGSASVEPLFYGRGSAILAEGKFIVLGERGLLALVDANPKEFHEITRVKLPQIQYPSWAAPVLSRKRLYLRDEDTLMCLDLAAPKK